MAKWRHLRMTYGGNLDTIEIFPSSMIDMKWLMANHPNLKIHQSSGVWIIESKNLLSKGTLGIAKSWMTEVEGEILEYLGETGWEGYAYVPNWNSHMFKKREE